MSEMKYTPGPWKVRCPSLPDVEIPPHIVREWRDEKGQRCTTFVADVHQLADANLIVRACNSLDNLLAACDAVIKKWGSGLSGVSVQENNRLLVALCDAANKAEGRT